MAIFGSLILFYNTVTECNLALFLSARLRVPLGIDIAFSHLHSKAVSFKGANGAGAKDLFVFSLYMKIPH